MPVALEKIFAAKRRPHWDPLICHISDLGQLDMIAEPGTRTARQLMDRFWPGPLTLLLPRTSNLPDLVTAGRPLVGVRMPSHPIALALLRAFGVPIAAPSANRFGHTSPTTAAHVLADLDGRIDAVLDGGPTEIGLESTVAAVDAQGVIVYRPGAIDLEAAQGIDLGWVRRYVPESKLAAEQSPSPGVDLRHYAPRARLILVGGVGPEALSKTGKPLELSLVEAIDSAATTGSRVGVLLPDGWNAASAELVYRWAPWHAGAVLAQRLYDGLRTLDDQGATTIICPVPEMSGLGDAIRDRLAKAAR